MSTKRAIIPFDSDTNQLPYDGAPASFYSASDAVSVVLDEEYEDDGVPVRNMAFSLSWPQLDNEYAPVFVRFRVKNEQLSVQSNWSVPKVIYAPVRYAIYKRRVATVPNNWDLVEVTKVPQAGPYQENWAGRVQYCVSIYHRDSVPASSEGVVNGSDFTNPYVLFATDPTDTGMNTKPLIA
jgi:hypothetical protein